MSPFFTHFLRRCLVTRGSDRFLELPEGVKWFDVSSYPRLLYIRRCYVDLGDILAGDLASSSTDKTDRKVGALITGTSGIGKTGFAGYLLDRFIKMGFTVAFQNALLISTSSRAQMVVFRPEGSVVLESDFVWASSEKKQGKKVVLIVDSVVVPSLPESLGIFTVAVSTVQEELYKRFLKDNVSLVRRLYMPIWSFDELQACWHLFYPQMPTQQSSGAEGGAEERGEKKLASLYEIWGGIPRRVLASCMTPIENHERELKEIVGSCRVDVVELSVGMPSRQPEARGALLHQQVVQVEGKNDYSACVYRLASPVVTRLVIDALLQRDSASLRRFVASATESGPLSSVRGTVFETFVHRFFGAGQAIRLELRVLGERGANRVVVVPMLTTVLIRSPEDLRAAANGEPKYCKPESSNFESVDAVVLLNGLALLIQSTVSSRHGIKAGGVTAIQAALPDRELLFCFAVPRDIEAGFAMQPFLGARGNVLQDTPRNLTALQQYVFVVPLDGQESQSH